MSNFHKELQKCLFLSFKLEFSYGTAFYVVYGIIYIYIYIYIYNNCSKYEEKLW